MVVICCLQCRRAIRRSGLLTTIRWIRSQRKCTNAYQYTGVHIYIYIYIFIHLHNIKHWFCKNISYKPQLASMMISHRWWFRIDDSFASMAVFCIDDGFASMVVSHCIVCTWETNRAWSWPISVQWCVGYDEWSVGALALFHQCEGRTASSRAEAQLISRAFQHIYIYIYIYIYPIDQNNLLFNLARILTNSQDSGE